MKLPKWIAMWLASYGVAADGLLAELLRLADRLDAPEEYKAALTDWFSVYTQLSAEKIALMVGVIWSELTSPAPGYDSDHAADA